MTEAYPTGHARRKERYEMLLTILVILLLLALFGGGWGYSRYGGLSWSPLGLLLIILLILFLSGSL